MVKKNFSKNIILDELASIDKNFKKKKCKLLFLNHHLSHASSCFYPSPYENASILTLDGVGEWTTTAIYEGNENKIKLREKIDFPHSLGLLYSSFTQYLGFKVNEDEYKVMGLAPYGEAKYKNKIFNELIRVNENGFYKLNMKYFNYETGLTMINEKFGNLFGQKQRNKDDPILSFIKI